MSATIDNVPFDFEPFNSSATPLPRAAPIDQALTGYERNLLRRLRQIKHEAITASRPAVVTIHVDDQGQVTWFVSGHSEG